MFRIDRAHYLRHLRLGLAAALLGLLAIPLAASLAPRAAAAEVTSEQAAAGIAADYGVEVLRVRPGEIDGKPVWMVTVMQPGGLSNAAFQVTTLAVDRASGALVPVFRHGPSGALGHAAPRDIRTDRRPDASRSGTWR